MARPAKRVTLVAMFTALAIAAGFAESHFPLPLPGLRLGVANIFPLTALIVLGPTEAATVAGLRLFISFFLAGSTVSFACSAGGLLLSMPLAISLYKFSRNSLSVRAISVASAFAFNVGQVAAIILITGERAVMAYLPALLACAAGTGFAVGTVTE
jgi:heptaprenyl diphosphate synthase